MVHLPNEFKDFAMRGNVVEMAGRSKARRAAQIVS